MKKASKKPAPATKRAATARPASRAAPEKVAQKVASGMVEKRGGASSKPIANPKAEQARKHIEKMGTIDSQRVEEHHRMTRHKKNQ